MTGRVKQNRVRLGVKAGRKQTNGQPLFSATVHEQVQGEHVHEAPRGEVRGISNQAPLLPIRS